MNSRRPLRRDWNGKAQAERLELLCAQVCGGEDLCGKVLQRTAALRMKKSKRRNSVDIVRLAEKYGYEAEKSGRKALHMKHSGGLYLFPETNRFFQWTGADSDEKGGAINFVMQEENLSLPEAVAKLIGEDYTASVREVKPYTPKPKEPVVLPEKAANFKRAYWYLVSVRGIDPQIVSFL